MLHKVFFGPIWSATRWSMNDIATAGDIEYCDFDDSNKSFTRRLCLSKKVLSRLPNRMQIQLYKHALKYRFFRLDRKAKILFIVCDAYSMFANDDQVFDFVKCLKEHFVNAKFVLYKYETFGANTIFQLEKKPLFDLFLTFNRIDAEKYGIEYSPSFCECGTVKGAETDESCDLLYVGSGASVNRSNFAIKLFKHLSDNGWRCVFYLPGMRSDSKDYCEQELGKVEEIEGSWAERSGRVIYRNSVFYSDYPCNYQKNISLIENSKAVLELIIPKGLASCTLRLSQVMSRNKKLVTNSITVKNEPFYNENNILYFDKPEDIDKSFLDLPFVPFDYDFSGVGFVNKIAKRLFPDE